MLKTTMNHKVDVVLLCGGKGSRFKEVTHDKLPKSLYPVRGTELIQHTLDTLEMAAVGRLIFAVDHHDDKMISWIQDRNLTCTVVISRQTRPGIAGALEGARMHIRSAHFVACNTDEIRLNFSLKEFLKESMKLVNREAGAMATAPSNNLFRHRVITSDPHGIITNTQLKNQTYDSLPEQEGVVNVGFLLLPAEYLNKVDSANGNDWSSIIDPLVDQSKLFSIFFQEVRYFNIGTATELVEATHLLDLLVQDREDEP